MKSRSWLVLLVIVLVVAAELYSSKQRRASRSRVPKQAYVVYKPPYTDLPISFIVSLHKTGVALNESYSIDTDMIIFRNHVIGLDDIRWITPRVVTVYGLVSTNVFADKRHVYNPGLSLDVIDTEEERGNFITKLKHDHMNKVYVFKKNTQRQSGIYVSKSDVDTERVVGIGEYCVVQEGVLDPYKVNGRKINIRLYMAIVYCPITREFKKPWLHDDGFVYYTKGVVPMGGYNNENITDENYVTTGYIDRKVYDNNPMTMKELFAYMKHHGTEPAKLWSNIESSVYDCVCKHVMPKALTKERSIDKHINDKHKRFMVFGVDMSVSRDLATCVMEINKGPDLGIKDTRDGDVKTRMMRNVLDYVLGV